MLCTERRLNLVEAFKDDAGMRKDLQTLHLKRVPDLMRIVRKFHQHKAGLQVRPRSPAESDLEALTT